jgi:hypothetical protein
MEQVSFVKAIDRNPAGRRRETASHGTTLEFNGVVREAFYGGKSGVVDHWIGESRDQPLRLRTPR